MIIEIRKSSLGDGVWFFQLKGKNGKSLASSELYRNKSCLLRCIAKITNTVSWKIREIK